METLADVVARDRRGDAPALFAADRVMDYRRFCTTAWKASNYLRHLGVAGDRGVVVLDDPSPPPLLTFFGAALLDAPTRFVESPAELATAVGETDARAVLVPAGEERRVDPPAGVTVSVHGGEPTAAASDHWEGGVWSENPAFVPSSATPESVALLTPDGVVTHGQLVAAARRVGTELDLNADDTVGVAHTLADPRPVAAVLAPLLVGGSVRLGAGAEAASVTVGTGASADLDVAAVAIRVDS